MAQRYKQSFATSGVTRFTKAPMSDVEFSRMTVNPLWLVPFNAGDIVPVYYAEVLPHDTFNLDLDFIMRQNTILHPTMGNMLVDFHAFFVPNRIVNDSWKNVMGENTSGFWSAPEVDLAPLYPSSRASGVKIPVGSLADYYGFPTQGVIPANVLQRCNDLKFRGYLACYNNYYRDQNYQPPIPFSTLNVYNGFLESTSEETKAYIGFGGDGPSAVIPAGTDADGSYPAGAIVKAIYGEGGSNNNELSITGRLTSFSALNKPLKANKLHDAFTSALPSPQKGPEVYFGIGGTAQLTAGDLYTINVQPGTIAESGQKINVGADFPSGDGSNYLLMLRGSNQQFPSGNTNLGVGSLSVSSTMENAPGNVGADVKSINLYADLSNTTGLSISDLRTAVAVQQVYETLARGGSRYSSMIRSFFGLDTESPFPDVPVMLGHIRRDLNLYQVAQTSASAEGGTALGDLGGYGYTENGGHLFRRTFLEHGYIHVFAVVRQRNIYSSFLSPDNFRLSTMDFYLPQFANISEQPINLSVLNPFVPYDEDKTLGFQEAWWDYRYEPDRVFGVFRSGVSQALDTWTYVDDFDPDFTHVNGDWLKSNAQEVLDRTLAVTSDLAPQLRGQFRWIVDKQRPMPVYSIPGMDII